MFWSTTSDWTTSLLGPSPREILVALIVASLIPVLVHLIFYRSSKISGLPSFMLVGSGGAGKTSLLTLFERGQSVLTHTSQQPVTVEVSLPLEIATASAKFRSRQDPSLQMHKRLLLIDTPGHAKIRYHAIGRIANLGNLNGVIFVVDAADCSAGSSGLSEAAAYLYEILVQLQMRRTSSKTLGHSKAIPVLVAVNKLDLFTAAPPAVVGKCLEAEIDHVRRSTAKSLPDSASGLSDLNSSQENDRLGNGGDQPFTFVELTDVNVAVEITGGSVLGNGGPEVAKWWEWIGRNL